MITPEEYIGGVLANKADCEEAEHLVKMAIENNYQYIQICWVKNGLGPSVVFNYYKLHLKVNDDMLSDNYEISIETKEYLEKKYPEIQMFT